MTALDATVTDPHITLVAARPDNESFAAYGEYFDLAAGGSEVVRTIGQGWTDSRTLNPVLATPAHLGFTLGAATPFVVDGMERHPHTREVLLCGADPVVVALAIATQTAPRSTDVRAFVLNPGDAIVLNENVWHTACYGVGKPSHYYWLATADDSIVDEWVRPTGLSVIVAGAQ